MESALTPHVCRYPALTCVNGPGGGVAWPNVLSPQHWSVPSILSPQASEPPALTSVNVPVGGVRFQQVSVLSVLRPQNEGDPATLTWVSAYSGGVASSQPLKPQQATAPSVLSPQVWSVVLDALASNPAANALQSEELAA